MPAARPQKKKAINVSIDPAIAAEAKAAGLNLSGVLEAALNAELKVVREKAWKEQNRETIEAMNAYVEAHGLPLAKFRTW
jgi:antitoxin CcdA